MSTHPPDVECVNKILPRSVKYIEIVQRVHRRAHTVLDIDRAVHQLNRVRRSSMYASAKTPRVHIGRTGDLIGSRKNARKQGAGRTGRLRRGAAAVAVVGGFRSVPRWKSSSVVAITGNAALGRSLQSGLPRGSRACLALSCGSFRLFARFVDRSRAVGIYIYV